MSTFALFIKKFKLLNINSVNNQQLVTAIYLIQEDDLVCLK